MPNVLVWDIETVPDFAGFAAANGHDGKSDDEILREIYAIFTAALRILGGCG